MASFVRRGDSGSTYRWELHGRSDHSSLSWCRDVGLAAQFRRVAQWQSASKHTGEVAAFDSCPAYQDSRPEILCLAHCVPNPPDKGEKIRLYHTLRFLAPHYRIHLVCFARTEQELNQA